MMSRSRSPHVRVLTAHKLHVAKGLRQANQLLLREPVLVVLHELTLQLPVVAERNNFSHSELFEPLITVISFLTALVYQF